jgi:hypothetical protein
MVAVAQRLHTVTRGAEEGPMMLANSLLQHRAELLTEWFDRILEEYPPETAKFLRQQGNHFANPVGSGLREALAPIFDELVTGWNTDKVLESLDSIIRVRAVQDFSPSGAVSFLFTLKRLLRHHFVSDGHSSGTDLETLDRRFDELVLMAFEVYSRCREEVFDIRVKQIRDLSLNRMERLNEWRAQRTTVGDDDVVESL